MQDIVLNFRCCFCDQRIESIDFDPSKLVIFRYSSSDIEEQLASQSFFCHLDCFYKKSTQSSTFSEYRFKCYLCNERIEFTDVDPCIITLLTNWDRSEKFQESLNYHLHFDCFKSMLHEFYKAYFARSLFLITRKKDTRGGVCFFETKCCFCKEKIEDTWIDPCYVTLTPYWDRETIEERAYFDVFCHSKCLQFELLELPTESDQQQINLLDFTCCFCKQDIHLSDRDPCKFNISGNRFDRRGRGLLRDYSIHFSCFEARLHNDVKGFLFESMFSIKEDQKGS